MTWTKDDAEVFAESTFGPTEALRREAESAARAEEIAELERNLEWLRADYAKYTEDCRSERLRIERRLAELCGEDDQ